MTITQIISQSINVPAGGVAFAGVCDGDNATASWSGLTERVDATFADDPQIYTAAALAFAAAQTPLSVTCTLSSGTGSGGTSVYASFGP